MTWDNLIKAAEGSPLLLAGLVIIGAVLALVERVFALSGPITKVANWWQGRELAKLKREALLRAERRRIAEEEEGARFATLRAEVDWLRAELERVRGTCCSHCTQEPDTAPMPRTRNPPRLPVPPR